MTLFELQVWLGHQSPATTQHYVSTSPTKLAQAYQDAGYCSRTVRAIEVLIDREAISSGAAASGSPWRYYELGHGWCSYEFFDQCPHRMACARCAAMNFSTNARIVWPVLAVTAIFLRLQTGGFGFKHGTVCSRCFRKFL